jgi:hypothetical protein
MHDRAAPIALAGSLHGDARHVYAFFGSDDEVIEIECRVDDLWRRHDDVVIRTCRVAQFGGDAVTDIVRAHPMVIIGGMLGQNPPFVHPEPCVPGRSERRATRSVTRPPVV